MTFLWPDALWLLLTVPLLAVLYVALLRRRKKAALRYASLGVIREALGPGQRLRRHVPPALLLLGLVAMIVAIARPTAIVTLPSEQRTIVMAMDVSLSMRANDIEPSRLAAAQEAAKAFVQQQPSDMRIGIVTFAGTAALVQPPTRSKEDLVAAIDRFELQRHTAIGSGIIMSLATLFPEEDIDLEKAVLGGVTTRERARGLTTEDTKKGDRKVEPRVVPPGSYPSGAIILLTDGRRTIGPDPLQAARMAADHGVRVFTVGFGRAEGGTASIDGYSMFMAFDEATLKAIADITRAEYFYAPSAEELKKVYDALNARFTLEQKKTEIGALASGFGAAFVLAAGVLSLLWFGRIT
jgi:Ca-activated chloride channel family protein